MTRHRAICEGQQILKEFGKMLEATVLGQRSLDEGFEDRYGYSLCEFAASDESESEEEGGHEPMLWMPSNM